MKKVIIAIHGLGNKPDEALLREWWLNAVHEGLDRIGKSRRKIPFEMVYWADISYPDPQDPAEKHPGNPRYLKEPYAMSHAELPSHRPGRLYLATLQFIETHLDKLFLRKNMSETFPKASSKMMEHYFTELDTYYTEECSSLQNEDCSAKAAIQARLQDMFDRYADHEILLLSHSMGSIIAFDVLCSPSTKISINTFISMGSPLGLPPIVARNFQAQKVQFPELKRPTAPESIWPHWYNISDCRDTVALDHTLRDDYGPNRKGLRAADLLVTNDYQINGHANPHKSYGYLRTPEVARMINTFLSSRRDNVIHRGYHRIAGKIAESTQRLWK